MSQPSKDDRHGSLRTTPPECIVRLFGLFGSSICRFQGSWQAASVTFKYDLVSEDGRQIRRILEPANDFNTKTV
jgi:hypothetical protein